MLGGSHQRSAGRGKTRARANVISKSILAGRLDQVVCDVAVNVARLSTKAKLPPEPDFVVDSDSIWEHYPRRIT